MEILKKSVRFCVTKSHSHAEKWAFSAVFALHFQLKRKNGAENPDKLEFSAFSCGNRRKLAEIFPAFRHFAEKPAH